MATRDRLRDSLVHQAKRSLPIYQPVTDQTATPDLSELPELEKLRSLAGEIRQHTLDHLDHYLLRMQRSVTRNKGQFYLATTADTARKCVIDALAREQCRRIRREPSLVCDEIGYSVPSSDDADALVTGANFAIAETGQVCICRNVISARTPRVIVCVLGIEAMVPRLGDLAVMLKLLGRSSIGRAMTVSTEILGAKPSTAFHVVFVDNGRGDILAGEHRPVLRCIGCGACAAVCPIYQELRVESDIGRAGPIAAVMSPLMKGYSEFAQLPFASTLCGACSAACPVGIDLPWHLLRLRRQLVSQGTTGVKDRLSHRLKAWAMMTPTRYRRIGSIDWKVGVPSDAPPPAAKSFHELWKARGGAADCVS